MVLENKAYTFGRLMASHRFSLPAYQRHFAWDEEHFTDLWEDVMNAVRHDNRYRHFMGQLICRVSSAAEEDAAYKLVDGQQRLTALTILVACLVEADEADVYREKYLYAEPSAQQKKITLHDGRVEDDRVLSEILEGVDDITTRSLSEQRLVNGRNVFRDQISAARELHGDDLVDTLLAVIDRIEFMVFCVENDEKAALIFETVNDRGKRLTDLEKTKSFLMHQASLCTSDDSQREIRIQAIHDDFADMYRAMDGIRTAAQEQAMPNTIQDEDVIQQQHFVSYIPEDSYTVYLEDAGADRIGRSAAGQDHLAALKWWMRSLDGDETWDIIEGYSTSLAAFFTAYRDLLVKGDNPLETGVRDVFSIGDPLTALPLLVAAQQIKMSARQQQNLVNALKQYMYGRYGLGNKRQTASHDRFYELAYQLQSGQADIDEIIRRIR